MKKLLWVCCWPSLALAQDFTWSARVLDPLGEPIQGTHEVRFTLSDAEGDELWSRNDGGIAFADGYATHVLGGVDGTNRPMDASWFLDPVYLSIGLDGGPDLPNAQAVGSSPRAASVHGAVRLTASGACDADNVGGIRYAGSQLEVCDGTGWTAIAAGVGTPASGDGSTSSEPGSTCSSILAANPGSSSGTYYVDPDGAGGVAVFPVHCLMQGGGWTKFLHIDQDGNQQVTGSQRNSFWTRGGNLDASMSLSSFSGLTQAQQGFIGWDRMSGWAGDVRVRVLGTNTLGQSIDEQYVLRNFHVDIDDRRTHTGAVDGGGTWTASVVHDVDTRSGWGVCGTGVSINQHVGLGICPTNLNGDAPSGREVQVWHYGNFTSNVNVSLGASGTGNNWTFSNGNTADVTMYFQPL